jgi:curved DNA-binding protein CbpA
MEDYYAVLGVARTASRDEIDQTIREQLRIWQRRTSNADLSRRQEAERRVALLGEARVTLLDTEKRRQYDYRLTGEPVQPYDPGPAPADPGSVDWLERARRHLADNDYPAAAYAARQARDRPNPPVEVWGLLARANAGLGKLDDALYEAQQATLLDRDSAQSHLDLAHIHEQRGEWREAFHAYETAARLDPRAEAAHAGMTRSMAISGVAADAVDRLERRYAQTVAGRDREDVARLLGRALVSAAEQKVRNDSWPDAGQVREIDRLLARARQVTDDPGVLRSAAEVERRVARPGSAGRRTSSPSSPSSPSSYRPRVPPPPPPRTNPLAVASLVLSLCGLVTCITAPIGAIVGHVAHKQIGQNGELGDGMAMAGIVVGWLLTALGCCGLAWALSAGAV